MIRTKYYGSHGVTKSPSRSCHSEAQGSGGYEERAEPSTSLLAEGKVPVEGGNVTFPFLPCKRWCSRKLCRKRRNPLLNIKFFFLFLGWWSIIMLSWFLKWFMQKCIPNTYIYIYTYFHYIFHLWIYVVHGYMLKKFVLWKMIPLIPYHPYPIGSMYVRFA